MPSVVLRVASEDFDVDSFLKEFPDFECDQLYHKGDVRRVRGGVEERSGFSVCVFDTEEEKDEEWTEPCVKFLLQREPAFRRLMELNVSGELDVGVFLYGDFLMKTTQASAELIKTLARFNLEFAVTCYACSDDDDDDHEE